MVDGGLRRHHKTFCKTINGDDCIYGVFIRLYSVNNTIEPYNPYSRPESVNLQQVQIFDSYQIKADSEVLLGFEVQQAVCGKHY